MFAYLKVTGLSKGWGLTQLVVSLSQGYKHGTGFFHTHSSHTPHFTATLLFIAVLYYYVLLFPLHYNTTFLAFCISSLSHFLGPSGLELCLQKCFDRAVTLNLLPSYLLTPPGVDPILQKWKQLYSNPSFLIYLFSPLRTYLFSSLTLFCRGGYIYKRR